MPWPARPISIWPPNRLGKDSDGNDVYLKDIWPTAEEIRADDQQVDSARNVHPAVRVQLSTATRCGTRSRSPAATFTRGTTPAPTFKSRRFLDRSPAMKYPTSSRFTAPACWRCWAIRSRPITSHPPVRSPRTAPPGSTCRTTASRSADFNSYGSRRGNDRVMLRGTFANIRIRNQLAPGTEGGVTRHLPDGEQMTIYDAAMKYQARRRPADRAGRHRVRHRQQSRLGRQGNDAAGRQSA